MIILALALALSGYGQMNARPAENGKEDPAWWKDTVYKKDTSAIAVILFDAGKCIGDFYRGTKITHSRRLKIYKKEAITAWGDIEIQAEYSRIVNFSATVYNMENGKIVRTDVGEKDVFKEKQEGLSTTKAAIPNVREGSVIEFTYTIKSNYFFIDSWYFQYSIPVEWSEYEIFFPVEAAHANVTAKIYGLHVLNSVSTRDKGKTRKYVMENMPAFKTEPFMPSQKWYRSSIEFVPYGKKFQEEYIKDRLATEGVVMDVAFMDTKAASTINFYINEKGDLQGKVSINKSGAEAIFDRRAIKSKGEDAFLKEETSRQWTVLEQKIKQGKDTSELTLEYELIVPNQIQATDSLLILNPYLGLREEINPLKEEKRIYPVDLGSRMDRIMITTIKVPDGYSVEQLPKPATFELPGRTASFSSNSSVIGNSIHLTTRFKTSKIIYNVDEYLALREFFARMVAKKSEPIVFKKKR